MGGVTCWAGARDSHGRVAGSEPEKSCVYRRKEEQHHGWDVYMSQEEFLPVSLLQYLPWATSRATYNPLRP